MIITPFYSQGGCKFLPFLTKVHDTPSSMAISVWAQNKLISTTVVKDDLFQVVTYTHQLQLRLFDQEYSKNTKLILH